LQLTSVFFSSETNSTHLTLGTPCFYKITCPNSSGMVTMLTYLQHMNIFTINTTASTVYNLVCVPNSPPSLLFIFKQVIILKTLKNTRITPWVCNGSNPYYTPQSSVNSEVVSFYKLYTLCVHHIFLALNVGKILLYIILMIYKIQCLTFNLILFITIFTI